MKIIQNIFASKTVLILFGIILFLLWYIIYDEHVTTYYQMTEKHAIDDVNFIVAYHNYSRMDCINDDNIIKIIKLLSNSRCIEVVDLGFTICSIESIKKICNTESSHLKSIILRGDFDIKKIISMNKLSNFQCLYKMQEITQKISNDYHVESLLLTK